jgi:hypothetical protein
MVKLKDEPDVLVAEGGKRVLRKSADVGIPDTDSAGVHAIEPPEEMQQRALADPGCADDGHHLAAFDGEAEVAQHMEALRPDVIALIEIGRREKWHQ